MPAEAGSAPLPQAGCSPEAVTKLSAIAGRDAARLVPAVGCATVDGLGAAEVLVVATGAAETSAAAFVSLALLAPQTPVSNEKDNPTDFHPKFICSLTLLRLESVGQNSPWRSAESSEPPKTPDPLA